MKVELINKYFGHFEFRTKFHPKLETSESCFVRNLEALEIVRDLIVF